MMTWCDNCKDYFHGSRCTHEEYLIYYPEYYGEEKQTILAKSIESAVEKFSENFNIDDPIYDDDLFETPIEITDKNGITKKFNCIAAIEINYIANEAE